MAHTYSLAYLTVPGVTPPNQTYIAARAGYDYVSYRLFHLGVAGEAGDRSDVAAGDPRN